MRTRAQFILNAAKWLLLFTVLVLAPLLLAVLGHQEESRGFWIEFGVGLGFIGFAMMGLQFVLTARYSKIGAPFGIDELLHFHGQAGYMAWMFIMAHFSILLLSNSDFLQLLDPTVNLFRTIALVTVVISICLLIAFTHWHEKTGFMYEWWRASHGLLAVLVMIIGTWHITHISYYVSEPWQHTLWVGMSVIVIGMLLHKRLVHPLLMKRKPYKVVSIREEVEEIWSIELKPVGHKGLDFKAGQFVWMTLGDTPFKLQQHPFTISSSPENKDTIRFTIKELGDFTSEVKNIKPGTTAFLEGPYGNFTMSESSPSHNIFISGGIGITPIISILHTMKERNDKRISTLIFGNASKELTPFYHELKALESELNLKIVHVFEDSDENWDGETGYITPEIIEKYLPEDKTNCEYFICGPAPMMDVAEGALSDWGVPVHMIHSERFNII